MRGTETAMAEGWWPPSNLPKPFSSKNPDDSPEAHACFPYIPPPQMHEQSNCEVIK